MATTIINPAPVNNNSSENNVVGYIFGGIFLIVFLALFVYYVLPALRGLGNSTNSGINVNLPKNVDVNVQQQK